MKNLGQMGQTDGQPATWAQFEARGQRMQRVSSSPSWLLKPLGLPLARPAIDAVMLTIAVLVTILIAQKAAIDTGGQYLLLAFPLIVVLTLQVRGSYGTRLAPRLINEAVTLTAVISIVAMSLLSLMMIAGINHHAGSLVGRLWLSALALATAGRAAIFLASRRLRERGRLIRPALIVGRGIVASQIASRLLADRAYGLRPIGFLDSHPDTDDLEAHSLPLLGVPSQLREVAATTGATDILVAFSQTSDSELVSVVRECRESGLRVWLAPRMYELISSRNVLEHLGAMPLVQLSTVDPKGWQFAIKHLVDRVVAGFILAALSPLMLVLALFIKLESRGPVFFRQSRVGRDGKPFTMLKFRTMRIVESIPAFLPPPGLAPGGLEARDRQTWVGTALRRASLDELPQLFNVLKGEMSLVGPRPERPEFVQTYSDSVDRYGLRHRVKPGMTGWAQVNGLRGQTSIVDRADWDHFYIENWSALLDFKVALLTAHAVVRDPSGVNRSAGDIFAVQGAERPMTAAAVR